MPLAQNPLGLFGDSFHHQSHLSTTRAVIEAGPGIEDDSRNLLRSAGTRTFAL